MKIAVVYVYAVVAGAKYDDYAFRFLQCYQAYPPGMDHDTVIMLNRVKASSELTCIFSSMPNVTFIEHDNSGYDIGAFQHAALVYPCDMMVFFGASTYFNRPHWLIRMASVFQHNGNAQYGAMGNQGDVPVGVWPHIRTTAFWMNPQLMNACPMRVTRPEQRHPFEHGPQCFTSWVTGQGLRSWVVTWGKELLWPYWDSDPQGYARGSQRDLLAGDRMTEAPYFPILRR